MYSKNEIINLVMHWEHWDEKVSTNRSKMDRIATIIEFLKKLEGMSL